MICQVWQRPGQARMSSRRKFYLAAAREMAVGREHRPGDMTGQAQDHSREHCVHLLHRSCPSLWSRLRRVGKAEGRLLKVGSDWLCAVEEGARRRRRRL